MHCGHMITLNVQSLCNIELQLVYCAQPKKGMKNEKCNITILYYQLDIIIVISGSIMTR